jgi:hypothetical protein
LTAIELPEVGAAVDKAVSVVPGYVVSDAPEDLAGGDMACEVRLKMSVFSLGSSLVVDGSHGGGTRTFRTFSHLVFESLNHSNARIHPRMISFYICRQKW